MPHGGSRAWTCVQYNVHVWKHTCQRTRFHASMSACFKYAGMQTSMHDCKHICTYINMLYRTSSHPSHHPPRPAGLLPNSTVHPPPPGLLLRAMSPHPAGLILQSLVPLGDQTQRYFPSPPVNQWPHRRIYSISFEVTVYSLKEHWYKNCFSAKSTIPGLFLIWSSLNIFFISSVSRRSREYGLSLNSNISKNPKPYLKLTCMN